MNIYTSLSGFLLMVLVLACNTPETDQGTIQNESAPQDARPGESETFRRELQFGDYRFTLTETTAEGQSTLLLRGAKNGATLQGVNRRIPGRIKSAVVKDLNDDDQPEVFIFTRKGAEPPQAGVLAFAYFSSRFYSEIGLAEMPDKYRPQYKGDDRFEFQGNVLLRKFPVYKDGQPTGQEAMVVYRLGTEGAGLMLKPNE